MHVWKDGHAEAVIVLEFTKATGNNHSTRRTTTTGLYVCMQYTKLNERVVLNPSYINSVHNHMSSHYALLAKY